MQVNFFGCDTYTERAIIQGTIVNETVWGRNSSWLFRAHELFFRLTVTFSCLESFNVYMPIGSYPARMLKLRDTTMRRQLEVPSVGLDKIAELNQDCVVSSVNEAIVYWRLRLVVRHVDVSHRTANDESRSRSSWCQCYEYCFPRVQSVLLWRLRRSICETEKLMSNIRIVGRHLNEA